MHQRSYYTILALLLIILGGRAQSEESGNIIREEGANLMRYLPPLSLLIDSAIANSPDILYAEAQITRSEYDMQVGSKDWTDLISVTGRYTYGQFITNDAFGVALTDPAGGYQIFAGFTLPLGYFVARNDRLGSLQAEIEMDKQQRRRTEMNIREEVIETYNQLMLLQRLLNISAEARESAILQYQMAEERFREGQISLEELGSATDMRASFASEYEKLRAEFTGVYAELERIVGTPFSKFPQ